MKGADSLVETFESFDISNSTEVLVNDEMKIQHKTINDKCTDTIVASLNNHKNLLRKLDISHNNLPSADAAIKIVDTLSRLDAITVLTITNNLMSAGVIYSLASGLANCLTLQELYMSHNSFKFTEVIKIAQALRNHRNLQVLDLTDNINVFLSETQFLVDIILSTNLSLTDLRIGEENLRPRRIDDNCQPSEVVTDRFQLQSLYSRFYFLNVTSEVRLPNAPSEFIKATENCPFLNGSSASSECQSIDSYYVDHKGGTFYNYSHNFGVIVPPDAVSEGHCVEIQATASRYGPFKLPAGCSPVSSYFWTSASYTFSSPVYLFMSHYAKFNSVEETDHMCVMHTSFGEPEIPQDGKQLMEEVSREFCYFDYSIGFCIFETNHFCSTCISKKKTSISEYFMCICYSFTEEDKYTVGVSAVQANKDCIDVRTYMYVYMYCMHICVRLQKFVW